MNIPPYDELVADLIKENLLDEIKTMTKESLNGHELAKFSGILDMSGVSQLEFLTHSDTYELRLPEFSFLDSEFVMPSSENREINNTGANKQEINTFDDEVFTEQKKLRRVAQKPKSRKNNKLCPHCKYNIPQMSIYCRFCRTRTISDLNYYLIIGAAALVSVVILLVILSDKNIR